MKKIELLAPAGSYDIFILALKAGADAVYFAGPQFGARAFAKNFSKEEVIRAIDAAHLFRKKAYLTVNTLLKDLELQGLYDYLLPFYEEGLDGIIVQDLGVLNYVKETFPDLEIHASTQMAIMGQHGIDFLQKNNVKRVVLARELSIKEIEEIKNSTNMELEVFVHGAMCYSYSGQCLLSSMIGGRSGNRGRCAQPCRLPYKTNDHNSCYPISMKDQCAINHLEELILLGVDSLKIEGRMKKPEYVSKVTAIYRKYIDLIYEKMESNSDNKIIFSDEDIEILENLYVRNSLHDGYFSKKNSKDMITLNTSAYKETKDSLLDKIEAENETLPDLKVKLRCNIYIHMQQEIHLKVKLGNKYYEFDGELADIAKNQPIDESKIKKQLNKTQDTFFEFSSIQVDTDNQCFVPMGELNAIRRKALEYIKTDLLQEYKRRVKNRKEDFLFQEKKSKDNLNVSKHSYSALVSTLGQFISILQFSYKRIYVPIEIFAEKKDEFLKYMKEYNQVEYYLALPYVLRQRNLLQMNQFIELLNYVEISGVLVRNIEEVGLMQSVDYDKKVQLDYFIYCMNTSSCKFWTDLDYQWTYPLELNRKEIKHILTADEMLIYGRVPVMLSANCVNKTLYTCKKESNIRILTDRMNKDFPIRSNCTYCYNVMYNSTPLSLHNYLGEMNQNTNLRLEFTTEDDITCAKISEFFFNQNERNSAKDIISEYTNGHYKRGVD